MATEVDRCFSAWRNGAMTSCEGHGGLGSYLFDEHSVSGFQVSQTEGEFRGEGLLFVFTFLVFRDKLPSGRLRGSTAAMLGSLYLFVFVRPLTSMVYPNMRTSLHGHHHKQTFGIA